MYAQRRQLAAPAVATDQDARNANFHLIHSRRRQVLEAQLEEKMEMLKQFTNSRGIGMRGQTVPQHDIDLLQQQIANLRQQLEGGGTADAVSRQSQQPQPQLLPPTPSNQASAIAPGTAVAPAIPTYQPFAKGAPQQPTASGGNWGVQQQYSQQQYQQGLRQAGGYPFPQAPSSTGSTGSRRDQVWQQKYDAWLRRGGRAAGSIVSPRPHGGMSTSSVVSSVAPSSHYSVGASSQPPQYSNHNANHPSNSHSGGVSSHAGYAPPQPACAPSQTTVQPAVGAGVPIPTSSSSIVSSSSAGGAPGAVLYGRRATPPASPSTQGTDPFAQRQPPMQWTQPQQAPPQNQTQHSQQQQQQAAPYGRRGQQNVSQRPW